MLFSKIFEKRIVLLLRYDEKFAEGLTTTFLDGVAA